MTIKKAIKIILLLTIVLLIGTGVYAAMDRVKTSRMFTVTSVEVKGVMNADRENLTKLSKKLIGLNIFDENMGNLLVTDDPWVQKLTANKVLPDSINLVVFEEKPLFTYSMKGKCGIFTGADKIINTPCKDVKINIEGEFNLDRARLFAKILADNVELQGAKISLKEYNFTAKVNGELLICPYDQVLFSKNYDVYINSVKYNYKRVDYVDLTINERIFVKGEQNGTSKG